MASLTIEPATPGDGLELLDALRESDRRECEATVGPEHVRLAVERGLAVSLLAYTARVDGRLGCVFGVVPVSFVGGIGSPWMLCTPEFDDHPRAVMRHCRGYIAEMAGVFPLLTNYVDSRNWRAIRWLQRCGFVLCERNRMGPQGVEFIRFELRT